MKTLKLDKNTLSFWFLVKDFSWSIRRRPYSGELMLVLSEERKRGNRDYFIEYSTEIGGLVNGASIYTPCFTVHYEKGRFILTPDPDLGLSVKNKRLDVSTEVWASIFDDDLAKYERLASAEPLICPPPIRKRYV